VLLAFSFFDTLIIRIVLCALVQNFIDIFPGSSTPLPEYRHFPSSEGKKKGDV
jgi:hypothetical protein